MTDTIICAERIGKRYRIRRELDRQPYLALRDVIAARARRAGTSLTQWGRAAASETHFTPAEDFWALRDVSFEVARGEVLGIIGRNGAGKSTLLKILTRITEPVEGRIRIRGRVASLLEVGTGFHPELTGRENVFLNGAILGMPRTEIAKRFDEIVAFAGVEQFLDTPVKRYSSGMYVRLAFAVAAHLETEILLVDEVLAVGDAAFQKKCLGRMSAVATSGRTVLFVSHNLGVIANFCSRAMLLDRGRLVAEGAVQDTIRRYVESDHTHDGERRWDDSPRNGNEEVRLRAVRVLSKGRVTGDVSIDEPFEVQVEFETLRANLELSVSLHLVHTVAGDVLSTANFPSATVGVDEWFGRPYPRGVFCATCTFPRNLLNEGSYSFNVVLLRRVSQIELLERDAIRIQAYDEGGMRREWGGGWIGVVRPRLAWKTQLVEPCEDC